MAGKDYEVDLYLRQKWQDERLKHADITEVLDLNDPNLVKAIWKPEVYFPNAKHAEFQFVTVPNVLIRINPDGEILYMLRLKLTFSCMMDLSKFPLDNQICTMEVASCNFENNRRTAPGMENHESSDHGKRTEDASV
ncbi:hypothetical protein LSTR_LSTR013066 [Laodelphax striatellus]|uniref:Neurotransmitter-gated ion-channel ligand-binding domain-containing protein n=1 Tax=Laodelphax striatellus TaxID=195883 RepID=A0A482WPW5_LAOST|nr:hypothetical protein LSTR_LSTR013066 [Laodelphax striatellus]